VEVEDPLDSILDVSITNKIPHLHECGGNGICTTCRIRVIDGLGNLTKPTIKETEMAHKRNWDPSIRLACQTRVRGEVSIQRLVWTSAEISRLQVETVPLGQGEERPLALLFCDLRDFTKLAENHSNFDLAHMLNRFFTILGDPILMNNGIIYQYAGDEIIGLFGTGGGQKEKICYDAIRAGLGMLYAVERLNKIELKDFNTEFQIGVGLHFGKAFVGQIGHPKHRQFAVIGDPVNVASRIESLNKELGTRLLVSDEFYANFPEGILNKGIGDSVRVKGKKEEIVVHEIVGFKEPDTNLEVQATLDQILKNEDEFAEKFYARVFKKAPQVRELFKKNLLDQGRMLTHMLGGIVYSLSRPEYLILGLKSLGRQHKAYGVNKEHYPVVKQALLETIQEELGEACNYKIIHAWENALDLVIHSMQSYDN
jgi:class 3 adenylate cyclase/hemoglobin-like flavoprotein